MKVNCFLPAAITALAVITFIVNGCGYSPHHYYPEITEKESTRFMQTVEVDNYTVTGQRLIYFKDIPQRIIVDGQEETEMSLAFCDNKERIMAVYGYYDLFDFLKPQFKNELKHTTVFTSGEMNKENILAMHPDLLIAEQCSFMPKSLGSTSFWQSRGIKTYVPVNTNSPGKHVVDENIQTEYQYILDFGKLFNQEERAYKFIDDAQETLAFFKRNSANLNLAQSVMIVENFGGSIASYDSTKLGGDIVKQLGGHIPETTPLIGLEELLNIDPDILFIVCSDGDHGECLKRFCDRPFIHKMKCYKNKRIYSLELESIYAPGIRIKDGIEKIGLGLYPELSEEYWKTQKNTINPSYIDWLKYKSMDDL